MALNLLVVSLHHSVKFKQDGFYAFQFLHYKSFYVHHTLSNIYIIHLCNRRCAKWKKSCAKLTFSNCNFLLVLALLVKDMALHLTKYFVTTLLSLFVLRTKQTPINQHLRFKHYLSSSEVRRSILKELIKETWKRKSMC